MADGFGMSLSSSDGYFYESGDTAVEFTIQSISKTLTYALAVDQLGEAAVDAKIGVDPVTRIPIDPMVNAGANAAVSLLPGLCRPTAGR